jgi:anti-anti-sigma factor
MASNKDIRVTVGDGAADSDNGVWVVSMPSTLTIAEAATFEQTVQNCWETNVGLKKLVIDLTETTFIDSSGLGALVSSYRTCAQKRIALVLRGVREQVMIVLSLTDLDKVFALEPAVAAAAPQPPQNLESQ